MTSRSFRSPSSSCSNVLNDGDVDEEDELTRSREYNSRAIKAKFHPNQSSTSRPVTFKGNSNQAQSQAREQENWQGNEEEQREGQEEATQQKEGIEEAEEVTSEPPVTRLTFASPASDVVVRPLGYKLPI
jgi:hypothetical protein